MLSAAKSNRDKHDDLLAEYFYELDQIEARRTNDLVRIARSLGVPVPPRPGLGEEDQNWEFNSNTGHLLSEKAASELTTSIRKKHTEQLDYQMLWVRTAVIPIVGLLATIIGVLGSIIALISLLHSLKAKP
ncbi:MAG: hypothetical protein DMG27_23025 [Acidobacteria bacterium]|nr:MAG: hypothetical protein DMG27_23025 [Acidobacteriota bacterium]